MCLGFKFQENKKARGGFPPPYTLGQAEVNNQVWPRQLHAAFEGCDTPYFVVVPRIKDGKLLFVGQQIGP
jgi:hypothetical protein